MSNSLVWERVGLEAKDLVQAILDRAPQYRMNVDGISENPNDGVECLTSLPPNCPMESLNYFFILHSHGMPIGVADVMQDYPKSGKAFRWALSSLGKRNPTMAFTVKASSNSLVI